MTKLEWTLKSNGALGEVSLARVHCGDLVVETVENAIRRCGIPFDWFPSIEGYTFCIPGGFRPRGAHQTIDEAQEAAELALLNTLREDVHLLESKY